MGPGGLSGTSISLEQKIVSYRSLLGVPGDRTREGRPTMEHRRRVGGIAALVAAGTFLFGIVLFVTMLTDYTTGDPTPGESVAFLVDNQAALYIWNLVIFIVFGIALVPVVLVLRERLRPGSPGFAQAAGAFGLIWAGLVLAAGMVSNIAIGTVADLHDTDPAAAEPVWSALDSVQNGLGGGNEIAGWRLGSARQHGGPHDSGAAEGAQLPRSRRRCGWSESPSSRL